MLAFTNCKINLGLDIVRRREDGYHDIVTVMVPVPWYDVIEIVPAKGNEANLHIYGNKVDCPVEKNLVMRAYRMLQEKYALPPLDIYMQKIIPDGAGLGGGSGDAAVTLRMLNDMMSLGLSKEQLAQTAAAIGADCPFFVYDEPMLCTGTGTTMEPFPIDLSGYATLIAKPAGVNVSTKQAYAGVTPRKPAMPLPELLTLPIDEWQGLVKNDFEPSVFALAPQIRSVKMAMLDAGAVYSSMSGSGASVFGFFTDDKMAESCMRRLAECQCWLGKL